MRPQCMEQTTRACTEIQKQESSYTEALSATAATSKKFRASQTRCSNYALYIYIFIFIFIFIYIHFILYTYIYIPCVIYYCTRASWDHT